jgi:hypothetical protein
VQNKFAQVENNAYLYNEPKNPYNMKSFKVRFHLAKGINFMKWQITSPCGNIEYFDPVETQLTLKGCVLKNHKKVAQTIFNGANKTVCAWVLCEEIEINTLGNFVQADNKDQSNRVRYNPRVTPNWVFDGVVVDGCKFEQLVSVDRGLYITK